MILSATEACRRRLAAAEKFHKRAFSQEVKDTSAVILNNTLSVYESYAGLVNGNSAVASGGAATSFKNFIITVSSLGIPALDVFDWVATEPAATASPVILFTRFYKMSNKGNSKQGDIISDPFGVNYRINADGTRSNAVDSEYTSPYVSDTIVTNGTEGVSATPFKLAWTDVVMPSTADEANFKVITAAGLFTIANSDSVVSAADGSVTIVWSTAKAPAAMTVTVSPNGSIYFGAAPAAGNVVVTYQYDNIKLPANDIPTYGAVQEPINIKITAHKMRIAFDAVQNLIYKHDYGVDLQKQLPKKAIEQFMFDIANEVADTIVKEAPESSLVLPWTLAGSDDWIAQRYASFGSVLASAQDAITEVTNIFAGNRAFIGGALLPAVRAIPGFKSADVEGKIGTQLIGTVGDLKIYRKPGMDRYTCCVFAKGQGTELSVGLLSIYAAVLPGTLIPTQMLETPDGLVQQGFYSLYGYKHLNPMLSVKFRVGR